MSVSVSAISNQTMPRLAESAFIRSFVLLEHSQTVYNNSNNQTHSIIMLVSTPKATIVAILATTTAGVGGTVQVSVSFCLFATEWELVLSIPGDGEGELPRGNLMN